MMVMILSLVLAILQETSGFLQHQAFQSFNVLCGRKFGLQSALLERSRQKEQTSTKPSSCWMSRDWIDEVKDDELLDPPGAKIRPDMKYLPRNVMRQNQNFVAIREAAGRELTNDLYVREPHNSQTFWFVGKIARVSDVLPEQAVSRQWNLIETHAAHLRPIELFPGRGALEIWMAPGDSEMEVAYNRPELQLRKMKKGVKGAEQLKASMMGFQGEVYQGGEEGFRTWRTDDGFPLNPEIESPNQDELRAPTDSEMEELQNMLEGQDINEIYKEQQRRNGEAVEE